MRAAARLPDIAFSLAQLAVLALLLYAIYDTGWSHRPEDIYTVLADDRADLRAVFRSRDCCRQRSDAALPLKLGEWSYAIYIGQTPLLQLLRHAPAASLSRARRRSSSAGPGPHGRRSGTGSSRRFSWSRAIVWGCAPVHACRTARRGSAVPHAPERRGAAPA